jgi:roadblock/LC7 domain-containing protein
MPMPQEMAQMTAQFCATVTMMFNTMAGAYTKLSQMNWVPQKMWTYTGGDYTVAIGHNNIGVFAETSKMDLNEVTRMLVK